jgi:hypothetical protein
MLRLSEKRNSDLASKGQPNFKNPFILGLSGRDAEHGHLRWPQLHTSDSMSSGTAGAILFEYHEAMALAEAFVFKVGDNRLVSTQGAAHYITTT